MIIIKSIKIFKIIEYAQFQRTDGRSRPSGSSALQRRSLSSSNHPHGDLVGRKEGDCESFTAK